MEIQDGSTQDYNDKNYLRLCIYSWGWIGNTIPNTENTITPQEKTELINKFKNIYKNYPLVTDHYMGHHTCEICGESEHNFNGTIRIRYKDKIYCSPAGVHHYIETHDYIPPQEVLIAIKKGNILNQEKWEKYNKNDEEYQKELKQRHKEFLILREKEKRKAKKERERYNKQAKAKLDRINKSLNPKSKFAKRLIDLFLITNEQ